MSSENIVVSFKASQGQKFEIELSLTATVLDAKQLAEKNCDIPASQQRLIYRGRILKDAETLQSYGISNGHTIHVVRVRGAAPAPAESETTNPSAPTTTASDLPRTTPTPASTTEPLGALSDAFSGIHPEIFQALLSNPTVSSWMRDILRNPNLLRNMLQANPLLEMMTQDGSILQNVLSDPETFRLITNPEMIQNIARLQQTYASQAQPDAAVNNTINQPTAGLGGNGMPTSNDLSAMLEELINRPLTNPTQTTQAAQQPTVDDATRFAPKMQQLEEMGFIDRGANLIALQRAGGDINAAITWLLESGHGS